METTLTRGTTTITAKEIELWHKVGQLLAEYSDIEFTDSGYRMWGELEWYFWSVKGLAEFYEGKEEE